MNIRTVTGHVGPEARLTGLASDAIHDNELSRQAHLARGFEESAVVRRFRMPLYDDL